MSEARYTEEQFAEILRRATEMQSALPARTGGGEPVDAARAAGLSLAEIRTIAGEVGIDPELVTRAAALVADDVGSEPTRGARWVLRGSSSGTLGDEDKIRIVRAIRDAAETHGVADTGGPGVEWSGGMGEAVRLHTTVETLGGHNEVRVSVDAKVAATLAHVFPTIAIGLTGLVIGTEMQLGLVAGLATMGVSFGSGLAVGRLVWRGLRGKLLRRSRTILAAVTAALPPPPVDGGS